MHRAKTTKKKLADIFKEVFLSEKIQLYSEICYKTEGLNQTQIKITPNQQQY